MPDEVLLHATCISLDGRGVLIEGPPGSGKSDLALQLIDLPGHGLGTKLKLARLVSDDQVLIERRQQDLIARPPPAIASLLEIRGFGIFQVPSEASAKLVLSVLLKPRDQIERMPQQELVFRALGLEIPLVEIDPTTCGAASKIRAIIDVIGEE